jgi:hypothetical protein
MTRALKLAIGLGVLVVVLVAGIYGYRAVMLSEGRTPEGYQLLTSMPGAASFAPEHPPTVPVLENDSPDKLAVDFGYRVAGISYSYSLSLDFPPDADQGKAKVVARHSSREGSVETSATRFWDAPRQAYAVALQDPERARYDLSHASLCVAQRDGKGNCHPETLACGLIRQRS